MIFKKLKQFLNLDALEKLWFFEVFGYLLFAKVVILLMPLRKVAPHLGKLNEDVRSDLTTLELATAKKVQLYINMVSNNAPWKSVCLDQALATMLMLNRRRIPHSLCLGVKRQEDSQKLDAHAWIECANKILVGGMRSVSYTRVAVFSKNF
jgi:hypothetical protein